VKSRGTVILDTVLTLITIAALVSISRVGNRLPMAVQDVDIRHESVAKWRVWASMIGSIALSLSVLIPIAMALLPLLGPVGISLFERWDFLSIWMIVSLALSCSAFFLLKACASRCCWAGLL
jgi:hypothetical protein